MNKKDVGKRLALQAFDKAYHLPDIYASGPSMKRFKVSKEKLKLFFNNVDNGFQNNTIQYFELAGANKKFFKAKASAKGDCIEVYSPQVLSPAYVRYAWAHNPIGANLYNKEGLPASPFELKLY